MHEDVQREEQKVSRASGSEYQNGQHSQLKVMGQTFREGLIIDTGTERNERI